jgi:hypothetical protein
MIEYQMKGYDQIILTMILLLNFGSRSEDIALIIVTFLDHDNNPGLGIQHRRVWSEV